MKQCSNCGLVKQNSDFTLLKYTKKRSLPIYRSLCKSCYSWKQRCRLVKKQNVISDLPGEIWKDIQGFEGVYSVSNFGRVKSMSRLTKKVVHGNMYFTSEIIIKQHPQGTGYLKVTLKESLSKGYKNFSVHRLVAMMFLPNPLSLREVNHLNGIKSDNRLENLQWISSRDNKLHAISLGLMNPIKNLPWNKKD